MLRILALSPTGGEGRASRFSREARVRGQDNDYPPRPALCRAVQRLCRAVVSLPVLPVADRTGGRARSGQRRAAQSATEEEGRDRAGGRRDAVGRVLCRDRLRLAGIVSSVIRMRRDLSQSMAAPVWPERVA